jgi:hypothetical protein
MAMASVIAIVLACAGRGNLLDQRTSIYDMVNELSMNQQSTHRRVRHHHFGRLALLLLFISANVFAQTPVWIKGLSTVSDSWQAKVDGNGNMITVGHYSNDALDFDPGPGTFTSPCDDIDAGFVLKLDSAGNFVWEKSFLCPTAPFINIFREIQMELDNAGNTYLAFTAEYPMDVDPGPATQLFSISGSGDAVLVKLDPNGNLVWAFKISGTGYDVPVDMDVMPNGDFVLTGHFENTVDFDPGAGVSNLVASASGDIFMARYTAAGALVWAKMLTASSTHHPSATAIDAAGYSYFAGYFAGSADLNPNAGTYNVTANGVNDRYLLRLDPAGNFEWALAWAGVPPIDAHDDLKIDANQSILMYGNVYANVDLDPGPGTVIAPYVPSSTTNALIKFDTNGIYQWSDCWVNSSINYAKEIATDERGNVYVPGIFLGTMDFDPGVGVYNITSGSPQGNGYIAIVDSAGGFQNAWGVISPSGGWVYSVDVPRMGKGYATGYCGQTCDFDPGPSVVGHGYPYALRVLCWKWSTCFPDTIEETATGCGAYTFGGQTYTTSGDYSQSFTNTGGCDSTRLLHLILQPTTFGTLSAASCNLFSLNGQTYTQSGIHTQFLTNVNGCDSILTLVLTVNASSADTLTTASCASIVVNGQTYSTTGTYVQQWQNTQGCDSTLVIQFTRSVLDTTVTVTSTHLQAVSGAVAYQWLDCDNNLLPIPGATQASFVPALHGHYAVAITGVGCTDTSGCHPWTTVGQADPLQQAIKVYPIPTTGQLQLELPTDVERFVVSIYNALGAKVSEAQLEGHAGTLQLGGAAGYYYLHVQAENGRLWVKGVLKAGR